MSLRINHNISAINSHRNLQKNDHLLGKSLEKLSSGLKVNRASDGPATLVISEQMRAQISGMNQAVSNSEAAVSMIQTAEGALNEVNTLLVSMRQLALHAANEGANDEVMLMADQQEVANSLATIDRISQNTSFGTKKLLDGSNGANGRGIGEGVEFVKAGIATKAGNYNIVLTQSATQAKLTGNVAMTEDMVEAGETLTIMEGGKSASYTANAQDTVATTIQNLRSAVLDVGLNVDVELEDGLIVVTHNDYGSDATFQASSTTAGVLSTDDGNAREADAGLDITGTINGESAVGKGQVLTGVTGSQNVDGLSIRYLGDVEQGEEGGEDGSQGTSVGSVSVSQNSLKFQVGANRNQTVSISLLNTSGNELARGLKNDSSFKSLSDVDVTTTQGAQDAILLIDAAINDVSTTRADLGAFQKNTLESNLSNLRIAGENLIAAESSIRDADMAAEMASFTRNQIMMQSATAMLAQANQIPKIVVNLLD